MLKFNPKDRISVGAALEHPWFRDPVCFFSIDLVRIDMSFLSTTRTLGVDKARPPMYAIIFLSMLILLSVYRLISALMNRSEQTWM